jgi:hypothetical protein
VSEEKITLRMKKIYSSILIAFLVTTLFACKKDKGNSDQGITGKWELVEYSTSWVPTITYTPGNGNTLTIADSKYVIISSTQVREEGTYTTMEDNTVEENVCHTGLKDKYTRRVDLNDGNYTRKVFYYIADDKLYMISGCYAVDGGVQRTYRRMRSDISGGNW